MRLSAAYVETAFGHDAADDSPEKKVEIAVIVFVLIGCGVYTGIISLPHKADRVTYTPVCPIWRSCRYKGDNAISKRESGAGS